MRSCLFIYHAHHCNRNIARKMSGAADEEMEDFFAALRNDEAYLAPTFYTAVGIVATLVIIIIILMIGYCYFARYLVVRTRLMNRYKKISWLSPYLNTSVFKFKLIFWMHRKVKLLTSPQDDDIIELEVKTTTQKPGGYQSSIECFEAPGHFQNSNY